MNQWVALLYSVVISANRRLTSADLISLGRDLAFSQCKTVISTGNLIFHADGDETLLTARIEFHIASTWGKPIPVLLRSATAFRTMVAANPFPEATRHDPSLVAVRVMRQATVAAHLESLNQLSRPEAAFAARDRALWVASTRQLSTVALLRAMAAPRLGAGTFRNASAIAKIAAALD